MNGLKLSLLIHFDLRNRAECLVAIQSPCKIFKANSTLGKRLSYLTDTSWSHTEAMSSSGKEQQQEFFSTALKRLTSRRMNNFAHFCVPYMGVLPSLKVLRLEDRQDHALASTRDLAPQQGCLLAENRDMRAKKDTAPNARKTKAKPGAAQGQNLKKLPRSEEIVEDPRLTAGSNKEAAGVRVPPHTQHSKSRSPANAERAEKPSNTNQQAPSESRAQGAKAFTEKGPKVLESAGSDREEGGEVQRLHDRTTAGQEAQGESSEAIALTQQ